MRVDWHGQSAFTLDGEAATVFIDPWGDMSGAATNGITWDYPAIASPASVDLLIVTHEHSDHNAVEAIAGEPTLVRSTAGTHESPLGDVVAIASEHDDAAGTERGPNTIVAFDLDGLRVCHFGDFGQAALRPEQRAHLDGATAATIAEDLAPSWVVPMHYRTDKINFLETDESFVSAMPNTRRLTSPSFDTADLEKGEGTLVVAPAAP
jgi:L-ascorbate metabolism protein UlaG (beta-lactamase superfamily)